MWYVYSRIHVPTWQSILSTFPARRDGTFTSAEFFMSFPTPCHSTVMQLSWFYVGQNEMRMHEISKLSNIVTFWSTLTSNADRELRYCIYCNRVSTPFFSWSAALISLLFHGYNYKRIIYEIFFISCQNIPQLNTKYLINYWFFDNSIFISKIIKRIILYKKKYNSIFKNDNNLHTISNNMIKKKSILLLLVLPHKTLHIKIKCLEFFKWSWKRVSVRLILYD